MIGSKIESCREDLFRLTATLHCNRGLGTLAESFRVPGFRNIGHEWARENGVDAHGRAVSVGERLSHRIEPGFRRSIGDDVLARADRADARDVDDDAPAGFHHALPDDGHQPERPLQINVQNAVVKLLAEINGSVVEGGFTCVVDEDVDLAKARVSGIHEGVAITSPSFWPPLRNIRGGDW